ncbi:hemerythrin domain-containing protein [Micromonospora krabiensis]|uniref:Hemerythrin HHE cation binding domain-containing protein n=1 Tax=Micromonospora krabiensis TaxID=307121 RepID=A0A1C3MWV8_9ACTN|nr:hemerythrin domain-containing protein [Micromonospora krabiensis]SBV24800.1 Hemerythrin HHE cation binding domain-containing protein [Micromonospora krabiensis]
MKQEHPRTNPLLAELRWIHDALRRDLAAVRKLADEASAGAPAVRLQQRMRKLQSNGPLFQMKTNCLQYCHAVHRHHRLESVLLFPAVRRSAPHLKATVDKLEADHALVSELLDQVEEAAQALNGEDAAIRKKLVTALRTLSDHLLEHLAFEEKALAPVLATWKRWPHG